jgi:hypothetical protein
MKWMTYDPSADLESPDQKAVTATAAGDIWTPAQMTAFLDHIAHTGSPGVSRSHCSVCAARRWAGSVGWTSI